MLKTSWSIEAESSTTISTSVCGLKYVPGTSVSSPSSITRFSASLASTRWILLTEVLELAELAFDLLLDVERLLPLPLPALIPGHHQLADLLAEGAIAAQVGPGGIRREQLLDLGLDVEGLAAPGDATIRARLDHLADLLLADLRGDRVRGALGALREVLLEREVTLADLLERVAGSHRENESPDRQSDQHHDDEDRAQLKRREQGHRHTLGARGEAWAGRGQA